MDIKVNKIFFVLFSIFWGCCISVFNSCKSTKQSTIAIGYSSNFRDTSIIKERSNLKKYALCKCLEYKFQNDSIIQKDGSLEGYLERGSYGNNAYDLIDSFVIKATKISYASKYKKKLALMRCIDIYDSKELDSLINSLDSFNSFSPDINKVQ